jgi:pimeloyl-ACP methyl ester carboxylesterase
VTVCDRDRLPWTALDGPAVAGVVTLATQSHGTDGVERLQRPLLLLHGSADPVLPWQASADVARRVGDHAELHVLDGSGHDLIRHRAAVRARVRDWLVAVLSPGTDPVAATPARCTGADWTPNSPWRLNA